MNSKTLYAYERETGKGRRREGAGKEGEKGKQEAWGEKTKYLTGQSAYSLFYSSYSDHV